MKEEKEYAKTIEMLKNNGEIGGKDKYVFCRFDQQVNFMTLLGTVQWSSVDYLLVAGEEKLRVFHINKKTGAFIEHGYTLLKVQISKLVCKKYLMNNVRIIIRSKELKFKQNFFTCDTFRGFDQKDAKADLIAFLKANYSAK